MKYKAKDDSLYNLRTANENDLLEIVRVHNSSAITTYKKHMDKYPVLATIFSKQNLVLDWKKYLEKCSSDNGSTSIIIEKIGIKNGIEYKRIVGVAKASSLQGQYKLHVENVLGQKLTKEELNKYANLQTIYIISKYQGLGLGKAVMGYFANKYSEKGCKYALTETLKEYEVSPKFFSKVGGAKLLGEYTENVSKFVVNSENKNNELPFKLWLMNDIDKMKISCYLKQKKVLITQNRLQKEINYNNLQLARAAR